MAQLLFGTSADIRGKDSMVYVLNIAQLCIQTFQSQVLLQLGAPGTSIFGTRPPKE